MSPTLPARDDLPPAGLHARQLEQQIAAWADAIPANTTTLVMSPLHGGVARYCRAMHALGVRGPQVRRAVGQALHDALAARVPCPDLRQRAVRSAWGMVDVIYLNGEHRKGSCSV